MSLEHASTAVSKFLSKIIEDIKPDTDMIEDNTRYRRLLDEFLPLKKEVGQLRAETKRQKKKIRRLEITIAEMMHIKDGGRP